MKEGIAELVQGSPTPIAFVREAAGLARASDSPTGAPTGASHFAPVGSRPRPDYIPTESPLLLSSWVSLASLPFSGRVGTKISEVLHPSQTQKHRRTPASVSPCGSGGFGERFSWTSCDTCSKCPEVPETHRTASKRVWSERSTASALAAAERRSLPLLDPAGSLAQPLGI